MGIAQALLAAVGASSPNGGTTSNSQNVSTGSAATNPVSSWLAAYGAGAAGNTQPSPARPMAPTPSWPQLVAKPGPVAPSGPPATYPTPATGHMQPADGPSLLDKINSIYSGAGPKTDTDALRSQYHAAVDPAAIQYSGLLQQGAPQYQPPKVSPTSLAGLLALGGLANATDRYNHPGQDLVNNTLGGLKQGAQEQYQNLTQAYQSKLENARAGYGLAKDQNQSLLDQADQGDAQNAQLERDMRQAAVGTVMNEVNATHEEKMQALEAASALERQKLAEEATKALQTQDQQFKSHYAVLDQALQSNQPQVRAWAMYHAALEGKPVDGQGHAIDPGDEAQARAAYQEGLTKTPADLEIQLKAELDRQQVKLMDSQIEQARFQSAHRAQDWLAAHNKVLAEATQANASAAVSGQDVAMSKQKAAEGQRQFDANAWLDEYRAKSEADLRPLVQYRDAVKAASDRIATSQKNLSDLYQTLEGARPDDKPKIQALIKDATNEYNEAVSARKQISPVAPPAGGVFRPANPYLKNSALTPGEWNDLGGGIRVRKVK